jgi:hypothetical protein
VGSRHFSSREAPAINARPQPNYAGDCGFCAYWAGYWQKLTAGQWWDRRSTALLLSEGAPEGERWVKPPRHE